MRKPVRMVISLFDFTANMVRPWAEAGYRGICVDIKHPQGTTKEGNIHYVGSDIMDYFPPRGGEIVAVFAFPPCTHTAISGARWFKGKGLGKLAESLLLFDRTIKIAEWCGAPYMIENPISTISTYWRKPDFSFDPCDFGGYLTPPGDAYTKKTCLWRGNGFIMPEPNPVTADEGSRMHFVAPGPDRAAIRSETPMGFAQAVFEANRR